MHATPRRFARGGPTLTLKLQIELVYDPGCPHIERARAVLVVACRQVGVPAVWTEWSTDDSACPDGARNLGSPSILVNGEDVAPGPHPWTSREPNGAPRSRVYRDGDSIIPTPPVRRVRRAIESAMQPGVG